MKHITALLLVSLLTSAFADEVRQVGWADLTVKVEFEDPFEKLDRDQLMNLSIYARIQRLIESGMDVTEGMQQEMDDAGKKLRDQGVDIDLLLSKREEIAELRRRRAFAMDEKLHGKIIRMPGYALALEYDGRKVKEFLLVPWVGACIHTPPPPPNQIVFVEASEAFTTASRFEPVWIEGTMQVGDMSKELFLVDGSSDIHVGYSMQSARIEKYSNAPKPVVRPGPHDLKKEGA